MQPVYPIPSPPRERQDVCAVVTGLGARCLPKGEDRPGKQELRARIDREATALLRTKVGPLLETIRKQHDTVRRYRALQAAADAYLAWVFEGQGETDATVVRDLLGKLKEAAAALKGAGKGV
jgi:hypothetical protein